MSLMTCLFTMFAEDVGLLPEKSFKEILEECEKNPDVFRHDVTQLWEAMNAGGWPPPANRWTPRASPLNSSEPKPPKRRSAKCWRHWRGLGTSRRRTVRLSRYGEWRSGHLVGFAETPAVFVDLGSPSSCARHPVSFRGNKTRVAGTKTDKRRNVSHQAACGSEILCHEHYAAFP